MISFCHVCLGKYYLVDYAYPNMTGYLAPYSGKNVPTFQNSKPVVDGIEEEFNYRHSSLRGIVKRKIFEC